MAVNHLRAVTQTPPRAILYLRQSTYREESISLVLQETAARDYCARMGYEVIAVEADPGVSGRTWKRPAVQRVMAAVEEGRADAIVLWRWSRLSRNRKDWAIAADRVDMAGGRIESATEPNDNTAAGRFGRGVMVELAAFESERIGEQWKEVHANRLARGLPSGRLPWGWHLVDGTPTPHPEQAPAIPELYRLYLEGYGARQLGRWLEEHGYKTFYGKTTWNDSTASQLLDSPFHSGQITYNGQLHPGSHEPLVSVDTYNRYLAMRKLRKDERAPRHVYLLSGMLTCATCQMPMWGIANRNTKTPGEQPYHAYRCRTTLATKAHGPASVVTHLLDNAVVTFLREYGDDMNKIEDDTTGDVAQLEAERLAREVASVDDEILQLTLQLGAKRIPERAYDAAMAVHEKRRANLVSTLAKAEASLVVAPTAPRQAAMSLLDTWDITPVQARRAGLRAILESMVVTHKPNRSITFTPRVGKPRPIAL